MRQFVSTLKVNFAIFGLVGMELVIVLRVGIDGTCDCFESWKRNFDIWKEKIYIIDIESEKRNLLLEMRK